MEFIVPSVIYQRRSFMLNTDIVDQGVAIKAYIPDEAESIIRPALHDGGYTDDDILVYTDTNEARKLPEYSMTFGARIQSLSDERLLHYKRIMIVDSDLFFAKSTLLPPDEKFPLVDHIRKSPTDNFGVGHTQHWWDIDEQGPRGNWQRRMHSNEDVWYQKAEELMGYSVKGKGRLLSADMSTAIYPREFLNVHGEWLYKAFRILQDDEAVAALWTIEHDYPFEIRSFVETLSDPKYIAESERDMRFYIAHMRTDWEFIWRRQIGADIAD